VAETDSDSARITAQLAHRILQRRWRRSRRHRAARTCVKQGITVAQDPSPSLSGIRIRHDWGFIDVDEDRRRRLARLRNLGGTRGPSIYKFAFLYCLLPLRFVDLMER
jgi:hypothetical protein